MTSAARAFRRRPRTQAAAARRRRRRTLAARTLAVGTAAALGVLATGVATRYVRSFPEVEAPAADPQPMEFAAREIGPASTADPLAALPAATEFTTEDFLAAAAPSTITSSTPLPGSVPAEALPAVGATVEIDSALAAVPTAVSRSGPVRLIGSDVLASAAPRIVALLAGTPHIVDVADDRPAIALARVVTGAVTGRQTSAPVAATTTTLPPIPAATGTAPAAPATTTTTAAATTTTTIPLSELAPETIVVVAGEHDFDPDVFSRSIAAVVAAAAPSDTVIVLTTTGQNAEAMNSTLPGLRSTHPNMLVADWAAFSTGHDEWFTTAPELSASGAEALALFVVAALFDPGVAT